MSDSTNVGGSLSGSNAGYLRAVRAEPVRVVLIEDDPDQALLTVDLLRGEFGERLAVQVCETVVGAIGALREPPDCVILDLSLPDAGQLEGLRRIGEVAPQTPIVVLSGRDDLTLAVRAIQAGAQDYLVKYRLGGDTLARSIRYAVHRKASELKLARLALVDPLTGLTNRTVLVDRLRLALARAERSDDRVAVLFADLDRFKLINDSLGHAVGDEVLVEVARRLSEAVRPGDTVARFGGDEFIILCEPAGSGDEAGAVAKRICSVIARPLRAGPREIVVGASVGVALTGSGAATPDDLLRSADQAMFCAKQRGSSWEFASAATRSAPACGFEVQMDLRSALNRSELRLHYQPQVDLLTRRVVGVEALVRWQHPVRGLLAPAEFVTEAEASGLIVAIGGWVLDEACRQLADWTAAGHCDSELVMSVNVSRRQLSDPGLPGLVERVLSRHQLSAEQLCLEVTESTVAGDPARVADALVRVKGLGVALAIDDFGTGESSLGVLERHPFDVLKVDRSFVARLTGAMRSRRVLAAIVGVARAMSLRAVVEGIETANELDVVARIGCDAAQGFLLGVPAEPAAITPLLRGPTAVATT